MQGDPQGTVIGTIQFYFIFDPSLIAFIANIIFQQMTHKFYNEPFSILLYQNL